MSSWVRWFGSVVVLAGSTVGCSERVSPPSTVPVTGVVMVNGAAAPGIRVTMHPQFSMGKITWGVVGETGPNGAFTMGTGAPGNGAPPGDYIVTFTKPRVDSDPKTGLEIVGDDFEGKYSDPAKSPWKVTIKRGGNVLDPFQLN